MIRRSHKKSKNGCYECRRRHIKCDETRPICVNCSTAERPSACSYPGKPEGDPSGAATPSPSLSPLSSGVAPTPVPTLVISEDRSRDSSPPHDEFVASINMVHLELFNHYVTETYKMKLPGSALAELAEGAKEVTVKHALSTPYLMHQVLALAARHLSLTRPDRSAFYLHQAIQLQTQAISLFNSTTIEPGIAGFVPAFLFSSVLGYHALCDALSSRDDDFTTFLANFASSFHIHRGVRKVANGVWPQLVGSELRPIVELAIACLGAEYEGHDCDVLRAIVRSSDLDESSVEACQTAIDCLQRAWDVRSDPGDGAYRLLTWGILLPAAFVELLERARPEALAILAYYAVLIHERRDMWVFGDAGEFLVRSIARHLGPGWADFMRWPTDVTG